MKKIIGILCLLLLFSAHTCNRSVEEVSDRTMVAYDDTLTRGGLDSLFVAETLSSDIENDWIPSVAVMEDKSDLLYKYVYIKELTDSTGVLYTLCTYQDTLYIISKRIMK